MSRLAYIFSLALVLPAALAMAPPLPSRPLGVRTLGTATSPTCVVELFLDLCCPFSRKMSNTLNEVYDKVREDKELSSKVDFVFHNVPQPWHPQSPMMHESMMAVAIACDHDPRMLSAFIQAMFSAWPKFADKYTADKSRAEIHTMCADIAAEALGDQLGGAEAAKKKVLSSLDFSHLTHDDPNMALGEATKLLKFAIKHHRVRGVHVTPTVFINSIEAADVSSSWTSDEWIEKLKTVCQN